VGIHSIISVGNHGTIGLWEMPLTYGEIESNNQLSPSDLASLNGISNEARKIQILSTRFLIRALDPNIDTNLLSRDVMGAPYFKDTKTKISISHSGKYVAVSLSCQGKTGIDIEKIGSKVNRIEDKFMSEREKKCGYEQNPHCINEYRHVVWGAKEALFKMYGKGGVFFKKELEVNPFKFAKKGEVKGRICKTDFDQSFVINYERLPDYMLVYVFQ
jgi:phosphopantetheinyl transferase